MKPGMRPRACDRSLRSLHQCPFAGSNFVHTPRPAGLMQARPPEASHGERDEEGRAQVGVQGTADEAREVLEPWREALRRFLDDGGAPIDNGNASGSKSERP